MVQEIPTQSKKLRFESLDVFRGMAIAAMILVNNPGSWNHVYPPLLHAEWHGFTPTDLVFPAFLFIVGVAMAFSLAKYTDGSRPKRSVYGRILRRSAILFALGLLLNGFYQYDWENIRIMGVLQRISLAYLISSLLVLQFSLRKQTILAVAILLAYQAAMQLIPVPGFGAGNLSAEGNFGASVDRAILGTQHLLKGGQFDPEGLFSTLPAVVTVLVGYWTGFWMRRQKIEPRTSVSLVIAGLSCLVFGGLWGSIFPINKALWTSSYVVFSAGWCLLLLAFCYHFIEVLGQRKWGFPFRVMGLNAIFLFVASGLVARILIYTKIGTGENAPSTYTWIYENGFQPWAGDLNGSLLFAIVTVVLWWCVLYAMYRLNWFL
ncbi:MAG: heparan-alpha-glucosaminide N-acetyltransferase domain-containing protein, partial [Geitlerinemataceae cyanobacterium]